MDEFATCAKLFKFRLILQAFRVLKQRPARQGLRAKLSYYAGGSARAEISGRQKFRKNGGGAATPQLENRRAFREHATTGAADRTRRPGKANLGAKNSRALNSSRENLVSKEFPSSFNRLLVDGLTVAAGPSFIYNSGSIFN